MNEADTERRKEREAAEARERAAELRREERLKKIAYMEEMPEDTPAGTGEFVDFSYSLSVLIPKTHRFQP